MDTLPALVCFMQSGTLMSIHMYKYDVAPVFVCLLLFFDGLVYLNNGPVRSPVIFNER